MSFQDSIFATLFGASDDEIQALQVMLDSTKEAFSQERGFTYPMAICGVHKDIPTLRDKAGNALAYTKPVLILTDELSASAAELFAAIMQDNGRGQIFGTKTNGAGGAVFDFPIGYSMEASVSLPQKILTRAKPTVETELPPAPYIENPGVLPDRTVDYMTVENLASHGKPFVDAFSLAVLDLIAKQ